MNQPNILDGTEQFMRAAEQYIADTPPLDLGYEVPDEDRILRANLLLEEYTEYELAEAQDDIVEVVDALLDIIVVAWGTLLTYVGPVAAKRAADEVTRSNLAKIVDGKVERRHDGKILKPEGWTPPNINGALAATLADL